MLSIIIPAWNEEKYLPRLLDSIKAQTYKDYEIIVADAGSKDRTREIAKKYGCKVVKGGMPGAGRNAGAKAAKGDFLFLDADVQLSRDFLKNLVTEVKGRNIDVGGFYVNPLGSNPLDKLYFGSFNLWCVFTQTFYPHAMGTGIFCKRWLHGKVNGFDPSIILGEDVDYVKRCGRFGKFRVIRSAKSSISTRRLEQEGRLMFGMKMLLAELYRIFFGEIRKDIFHYHMKYRR